MLFLVDYRPVLPPLPQPGQNLCALLSLVSQWGQVRFTLVFVCDSKSFDTSVKRGLTGIGLATYSVHRVRRFSAADNQLKPPLSNATVCLSEREQCFVHSSIIAEGKVEV